MAEVLQQRTELEVLLRQCLDDVKAEILRSRPQQGSPSGSASADTGAPPGSSGANAQAVNNMSVHELGTQDRERVLELLLSQQRVVQLLYSKTFSQANPPSPLTRDDSDPAAATAPARVGSAG